MSHRIPWTVKSALVVLAVAAGVGLMSGLSAAAPAPDGGAAAVSAAGCAGTPVSKPADDRGTTPARSDGDNGGSTGACRRAPECAVDSDCDVICGPGLGKCVHSNCPVRVCHCR